jgi:hypothetical protein
MKQGWIGVVAGLAVGFTAVFLAQRGGNAPTVRRPDAKATAELVTRCHAPLAPAYERAAEPLHRALTTEPGDAMEAAHAVSTIIEVRLGVCKQALAAREAEKRAGSDIAQLEQLVVKLATVRARVDELIGALSSSQASDAQQKLDAVDAAMRDATGSG